MRKLILAVLLFSLLSFPVAASNSADVRVTVNQSCGSSFHMLSEDGRDVVRENSVGFFTAFENRGNLNASYTVDSWVTADTSKDFGSGSRLEDFDVKNLELAPNNQLLNLDVHDVADNASTGSYEYRSSIGTSCEAEVYSEKEKSKAGIEENFGCDTGQESFECSRSSEKDGWELEDTLSCESLNSTYADCRLQRSYYRDVQVSSSFNIVGSTFTVEPKPIPEPVVDADLSLVDSELTAKRGGWKAVEVEVENTGNIKLQDLEVVPRIEDSSKWSYQPAKIENLSRGEERSRTVYIRPDSQLPLQQYTLPMALRYNGSRLDTEYLDIELEERTFVPGIHLVGSIDDRVLDTGESETIELNIQNTGNVSLEDIEVVLQNFEDCGTYSVEQFSDRDLPVNSSRSFELVLEAGDRSSRCSTSLVVGTDGVYDFGEFSVLVLPEPALVDAAPCWFPLLLWLVIAGAYLLIHRNRDVESRESKILLLLIMEIGGLVFLYTLIHCYYPGLSVLFPSLL